MKNFIAGLIIGLLIATAGIGTASNDVIRIFINGEEIAPDVPPVIIDGRTMVPARFIAEPLGATVEWDSENRDVLIMSREKQISESEWISIRELSDIGIFEFYGPGHEWSPDDSVLTIVETETGLKHHILESEYLDMAEKGKTITINSSKGPVQAISINGQTKLNINDLQVAGFEI